MIKEAPLELYRQMLIRAIEIQEIRGEGLWRDGDRYTVCAEDGSPGIGSTCKIFVWTDQEDEPPIALIEQKGLKVIYLPDQEAYQRMLDVHPLHGGTNAIGRTRNLISWNYCEFVKGRPLHKQSNLTMDMLWLGYVMSAVYLKRWNGEEWLKMGDGYYDAPDKAE